MSKSRGLAAISPTTTIRAQKHCGFLRALPTATRWQQWQWLRTNSAMPCRTPRITCPCAYARRLVPAVNIGSWLGWILIMIGLFLNMTNLAWLGVLVFSGGAVFALATLPVELNASVRAKQLLAETGIIQSEQERRGVNNVLNAAALTYVASLVTAILQLLYFVSLIGGRRR